MITIEDLAEWSGFDWGKYRRAGRDLVNDYALAPPSGMEPVPRLMWSLPSRWVFGPSVDWRTRMDLETNTALRMIAQEAAAA